MAEDTMNLAESAAKPESVYIGYFFVLLAAALWALLGSLALVPMRHGITPLETAFWRAFFGGALFLAHGLIKGSYKAPPKAIMVFSGFGVVGIAVLFAIYNVAVQRGGVAMAAVLLYTAPAWVALFSRLLFKETLTAFKILSMLLALGGVVLVSFSGGGLPDKADHVGIAAGLASGLCYSMHYVFGKAYLNRYSSITLYMYCLPVGAICLFPFVQFGHKEAADWLCFVGLGLFSTYGAYWAYCEGLRRLAPTRVAVLCNLEPLLAAVFGFAFWGELFPFIGWVGAALILAAVFLVMFDGRRNN